MASVLTTTKADKGVIAIPPMANVDAITRSVMDETTTQTLGREDHSRWRSRLV